MESDDQRTVLVVDDDSSIRRLIGRVVELEGCAPVTVETGEEALELLDAERFDLLVADKNLPGINGLELARIARTTHPQMPVLLVPGYASLASARQAAAQGIIDYVLKPVELDELRARLRRGLEISAENSRIEREIASRPAGARGGATHTLPPPASSTADETTVPPERAQSPAGSVGDDRTAPLPSLRGRKTGELPAGSYRMGGEGEATSAPTRATALRSDGPLDVLVVELDGGIRGEIVAAISSLGHSVISFPSRAKADAHVQHLGYDVLVADAETLQNRQPWLKRHGAGRRLGALAIVESDGLEKMISAIQLGARGIIAPPFEAARVCERFNKALTEILEADEPLTA